MGQKYASCDANGAINAFYDESINSVDQIGDAIKITDSQWHDCVNNPGKWIIVSGALQLAPQPSDAALLASAQASQIAILTSAYNTAIQKPVAYMSTTFQADADSQNKIMQVLTAMTPAGAAPEGFYWVDANNNHVPMTLAQVQGLAQAMMNQGWAAFQNLQVRKASVNAASTVDAIKSIQW